MIADYGPSDRGLRGYRATRVSRAMGPSDHGLWGLVIADYGAEVCMHTISLSSLAEHGRVGGWSKREEKNA